MLRKVLPVTVLARQNVAKEMRNIGFLWGSDNIPNDLDLIPVELDIFSVELEITPFELCIIPVELDILSVDLDIIPSEMDILLVDLDIIPVKLENTLSLEYFAAWYSISLFSTWKNIIVHMLFLYTPFAYSFQSIDDMSAILK